MNTHKPILRLFFFAVIILLLAGCEKLLDFVPNKAVKDCRIKKIVFFPDDEPSLYRPYSMTFYYNKWGNPDSIILSPLQGENFSLYFLYNNKRQLVGLEEGYRPGLPVLVHKFGYNKGQIISDTLDSAYGAHSITTFEYDRYDRMIKSTFRFPDYPDFPSVIDYQYDSHGNLIHDPSLGVVYDNKVNLHQLNPIWLFLARDYSVNNPLVAVSYNNFRLPTKFDSDHPLFGGYEFIGNSLNLLDKSEITYDCKGNNDNR